MLSDDKRTACGIAAQPRIAFAKNQKKEFIHTHTQIEILNTHQHSCYRPLGSSKQTGRGKHFYFLSVPSLSRAHCLGFLFVVLHPFARKCLQRNVCRAWRGWEGARQTEDRVREESTSNNPPTTRRGGRKAWQTAKQAGWRWKHERENANNRKNRNTAGAFAYYVMQEIIVAPNEHTHTHTQSVGGTEPDTHTRSSGRNRSDRVCLFRRFGVCAELAGAEQKRCSTLDGRNGTVPRAGTALAGTEQAHMHTHTHSDKGASVGKLPWAGQNRAHAHTVFPKRFKWVGFCFGGCRRFIGAKAWIARFCAVLGR